MRMKTVMSFDGVAHDTIETGRTVPDRVWKRDLDCSRQQVIMHRQIDGHWPSFVIGFGECIGDVSMFRQPSPSV